MIIETIRLQIIALAVEQFHLLLCDKDQMEREFGLAPSNKYLDKDTQQAMEGLYAEALKHKDNYLWYTNWQVILKSKNVAIGSACFMKEPDKDGIVEIGYGIEAAYQNKGYMTEAVRAISQWALEQYNVTSVVAETEKDNYASHNVLRKIGMSKYNESDNSFWWKLNK